MDQFNIRSACIEGVNITEKNNYGLLFNLTIVFYSVYAIKCVWLAFASTDYFPVYYQILNVVTMGCAPLGLLTLLWQKKLMIPRNFFLLLLPFIFYSYSVFHNYREPEIATDTFTLVVVLCYILFSYDLKIKIFDLFYQIIQITNLISVIFFLLYVLHINIGFETVPYYSELQNFYYVKWFIFAIFKSNTELRLCGIFNEPGALGTVCALLFIARFRYSTTWEKVLLLAAILCTFSMAGFLLIFIFAAAYLVRKNPKNLVFLGLFIAAFLAIPNIDFRNDYLNNLAGRFAIKENGFEGNNRTKPYFDRLYLNFMQSNEKWLGYGKNYPMGVGNSSYKTYVVEYGIIGFAFWIMSWINAALRMADKNKDCLLFTAIFVISLYQRPRLIQSIYGYVLLFGGIAWIKQERKKEKSLCHKLLSLLKIRL